MVEKIEAYRAKDKELFTNENLAKLHEYELEFYEWYEDNKLEGNDINYDEDDYVNDVNYVSAADFKLWISNHSQKLRELLLTKKMQEEEKEKDKKEESND